MGDINLDEIYAGGKGAFKEEKKTVGERIEDFFYEYGNTIIVGVSFIAETALVLGIHGYLKAALKNGNPVCVNTLFPVKLKK